MNQIKIGEFISELRKEEGLTQIELGEKLGVSNKAVSKWENGKCLPDPSLYEPLCSILHISLTELFNGERIKKEEVLEKSDQILSDVMQHAKSNKILDFISSILIVSAILLFFMPTLKEFDQTLSIITISIGLLLLTLGLSLKLFIWQRINNKKIKNTGMGFTSGLTLLFIALKLTGYIDWPWIWVISPIWIVILLLLILFAIVMIGGRIKKGKW